MVARSEVPMPGQAPTTLHDSLRPLGEWLAALSTREIFVCLAAVVLLVMLGAWWLKRR